MIDDDERAALERELAADLTDVNLNDDNVGVEPNEVAGITTTGGEIGLAHRDLDERLRAVGQQQIEEEKQASGSAGELSTWELLLQSVDQSDREFFGAMNADIDNIRAILTSESDGEKQQIEAPIQEGNGESGLPSPLLTGALPKVLDDAGDNAFNSTETSQQPVPVRIESSAVGGDGVSETSSALRQHPSD